MIFINDKSLKKELVCRKRYLVRQKNTSVLIKDFFKNFLNLFRGEGGELKLLSF